MTSDLDDGKCLTKDDCTEGKGLKIVNLTFERGVSLAIYKRLLSQAVDAVYSAFGEEEAEKVDRGDLIDAGIPAPMANVFMVWKGYQENGIQMLSELMSMDNTEVARKHRGFVSAKKKFGEATLEGMFRVVGEGRVVSGKNASGLRNAEDIAFIYSIYTLAVGAEEEVKSRLAEAIASKIL